MRPLLRKHALFSDGTKDYRNPPEPKEDEEVTITFRTAKDNVDIVWLRTDAGKIPMWKEYSRGLFDYYQVKVQLGKEPFRYYFEINTGMLQCYYDRMGVSPEIRQDYAFVIVPGFSTPDWAKGHVPNFGGPFLQWRSLE